MKYFLLFVIANLLVGCSGGLFNNKERDARNSFVERPLIIPSNIDTAIFNKEQIISQEEYIDAIVFQLIFSENLNNYQQKSQKLALTINDIKFLKKAGTISNYSNIRNELNKESLAITNKNNRFLNKILHWQVDESIKSSDKKYKEIN